MQTEIPTKILKQHADEFPDPVSTLIRELKDSEDSEKLIADLGTFERILKLDRTVKN